MEQLEPLILQSLELLVIGMGTVFIILGLLIIMITLVTRMLTSLKPGEEPVSFTSSVSATTSTARQPDEELVAVISSAVSRYRKSH